MCLQIGIVSNGHQRTRRMVPIPSPENGEVLVKNVAVTSNPKDWKFPLLFRTWADVVEGNDVAGYVEEVGEDVTGFEKGDKVAGLTPMMKDTKYGAYQQYTVVPSVSLFPLPADTTFEEAATYPMTFLTAAIGLFSKLQLPTPVCPVKPEEAFPILIWGASSSIGTYAVQLAKLAGLKVIAVAGNASEYAKELGADEVVDYRNKSSDDLVAAFTSALGGDGAKVTKVYDAVSDATSLETIVQFLSSNLKEKDGGGKATITAVLPTPVTLPESGQISLQLTYVGAVNEDSPNFFGTSIEKEHEFAKEWLPWLSREGKNKIKPNRVRVIQGGLDGVDAGLKLLEEGKVSGEKLVYRIGDTGGI
ncbi:GroES-like protein [Atractiella rhizophila]|nr:GroES-like protein [Atractiella rhizophila]